MRGGRSIPTVPGAGDVVVGEPELTLEQAEKLLEELHAEFPVAAGLGRADGGDEGGMTIRERAGKMAAALHRFSVGKDLPDGLGREVDALEYGADEVEVGGRGHGGEAAAAEWRGQAEWEREADGPDWMGRFAMIYLLLLGVALVVLAVKAMTAAFGN